MGFWDDIKTDLKKAVEDSWTVVKDGARKAAGKSEEIARSGKLKYASHQIHKDASQVFADLGGIIFDLSKDPEVNPFSNHEVKRLLQDIKKLEGNSALLEETVTTPSVEEGGSVPIATPVKKSIKKKTTTTKKKAKKSKTTTKAETLKKPTTKTKPTTKSKATTKAKATSKAKVTPKTKATAKTKATPKAEATPKAKTAPEQKKIVSSTSPKAPLVQVKPAPTADTDTNGDTKSS